MPSNPLTVTLPEPLLKRIRGRARRAKRTVEAEIVQLLSDAVAAGEGRQTNGALATPGVRPDRPEADAEGESLPTDIVGALAEIERLDDRALRKAATPIITPRQAERLADLNRKAQDEGLSDREEKERDKLLHLYEKSMVVRSKALAELHKRGLDVSDLLAQ